MRSKAFILLTIRLYKVNGMEELELNDQLMSVAKREFGSQQPLIGNIPLLTSWGYVNPDSEW